MKTAPPPLAGRAHRGHAHRARRRARADRRHRLLVDRLPRLQPSRTSARRCARQLEPMPHVMFGGLAHEPAYTSGAAARGAAAGRSRPRVLRRFGLGRGRGRDEDGGAILAQPRRARPHPVRRLPGRLSRRHLWRRWRCAIPRTACTRSSPGLLPRASHRRSAARRGQRARRSTRCSSGTPTSSPASSSSRWCRARAACSSMMPACCAACARRPTATACC